MADPKTASKTEVEDKATSPMQTGWKFWALMAIAVSILAGYHYRTDIKGWFKSDTTDITGGPPNGLQVGGRPGEGSFTTPQVIKVKLDPKEWSDWIELPAAFKATEFDAVGAVEFLFLNGEKKRFRAGQKMHWNFPCGTFKMRGDPCEATVVVRY